MKLNRNSMALPPSSMGVGSLVGKSKMSLSLAPSERLQPSIYPDETRSEVSERDKKLNERIIERFELEDPGSVRSVREAWDLIRLR